MSRIGRKPVKVPKGAKVALSGNRISVEGPKGSLAFEHAPLVSVSMGEGGAEVVVTVDESAAAESKQLRALWGTTRAIINNMMLGVTQGYTKKLEIVGVGWRGEVTGGKVRMRLGFAHLVEVPIPQGLTVTFEKDQNITVAGADKQAVGQFASILRSKRKPEPYNGKGVKYSNEVIQRKQGKAFGK